MHWEGMKYNGKIRNRFWDKVDKSGECWEWRGDATNAGYGKIWVGNRACFAHRVSWELENGDIPTGLVIRHKCDNPRCVKPTHLEVGSHGDNARDRVDRGRQGVRPPTAPEIWSGVVKSIKYEYYVGASAASLARKYQVDARTIWRILGGHVWGYLTFCPHPSDLSYTMGKGWIRCDGCVPRIRCANMAVDTTKCEDVMKLPRSTAMCA